MQAFDAKLEIMGMLLREPRTGILFALLAIASVSDYFTYKIPNWLTVGGMLFGLAYNLAVPFSVQHGLLWALGGMMMGFLAMLPFYGFGIMGAGDVKLMAMTGACLGVADTLYAVIFSFIIGGIASLAFALANRVLTKMLVNVKNAGQMFMFTVISGLKPETHVEIEQSVGKLPYGICISIGTFTYLMAKQFYYV